MQAVILAAGMGKRLGEYTHDNTKCMLEVNGIRLIDRMLDSLHDAGISRVILVVGYKGQNVKEYIGDDYCGMPVLYVDNPIYDKTNNIYSFYLAKDYLEQDDTVLLESDLIFAPSIIKKLLADSGPSIALVDKYESWMDGTVVTLDDCNRISRFIDKNYFNCDEIREYYKTVNIYKFSKEFLKQYYIPFLEAYCKALGNNSYYEQVLRVILHLHDVPIKALPLEGEIWYEIDDVQDLDIASGMFAPSGDEQYAAISSRYGGYWRYPHMIDYCYLVNPFFPPGKMLDEMKMSFEKLMTEYPSGMKVNSLLASKNFNVKKEYIVVGNGAAELIKALMESISGTLGYILPTFEEYPNRLPEDRVIAFKPETEDFHYSADDVMEFFDDKQVSTILLINPDNPSGNYIPRKDIMKLIEWTKQRAINFVLDESFVDFADEESTFLNNEILTANQHLVVIKSISKSYGVPGLRLGILASGNVEYISKIKTDVAIWNVNSFGEFFMQILEKYNSDYQKSCNKFRFERERFREKLAGIPFLKVFDSQANYFLCKITGRFTSRELAIRLLEKNVLIKDCNGKAGMEGHNLIRIAVRDEKDNSYLVNILKTL